MLDRLADPTLPTRRVSLPPRLVVRESCGAYLPRPKQAVTARREVKDSRMVEVRMNLLISVGF
jgi:hypothetical protein